MVRFTHPGSFRFFNISDSAPFRGRPSFAGGIWGFVRGSPGAVHLLQPWVRCSREPACIAPTGASLGNHRFDQAVGSIIT